LSMNFVIFFFEEEFFRKSGALEWMKIYSNKKMEKELRSEYK
jgi:hypothetical protein